MFYVNRLPSHDISSIIFSKKKNKKKNKKKKKKKKLKMLSATVVIDTSLRVKAMECAFCAKLKKKKKKKKKNIPIAHVILTS